MSDRPPKIAPSAPPAGRPAPPAPNTGAAAARFRQRAFRAGFTQLPNVVLASQRLSPTAKVTYAVLCQFAWREDAAWPHRQALAAQVNVQIRVLSRALRELRLLGLVTVERRGLGRTNVYWLEPLDTFAEEEHEWQRERAPAPAPAPEIGDAAAPAEGTNTPLPDGTISTYQESAQTSHLEGAQTSHPLLRKKKTQRKEDTTTTSSAPDADAATAVVVLLTQAGIARPAARRLVARHGLESCRQQVDWLPLRKPRDAAAVLRRAIEESWLAPGGDPKLRLPGERPYVPLAPPALPVIDVAASDRARLAVRAELALRGLAGRARDYFGGDVGRDELDGQGVDDREGAGR